MPNHPRVVISGLGFITSVGNDICEVDNSLKNHQSGIESYEFKPGCDLAVKVLGTIKGFNTDSPYWAKWHWPERYKFEPPVLRSLAPHGLYALCAAQQAVSNAGLVPADIQADDTALFTASAGSSALMYHNLKLMHANLEGRGRNAMGVVSSVVGTLNFNLGTYYKIRGGNCGFVSACASSSHALGYAYDGIRSGQYQRILVVGAEDVNLESVLPFSGMQVLSTNPDPRKASRPFDVRRDGFVGSGGAVAIILESETSARNRGVKPYAEMKGWGQTSDGYNVASPDPEGDGLYRAMRKALSHSGVEAVEVGYVNAHAASTPQGDSAEAKALVRLFGPLENGPAISSTKGLTGHPLSMSGIMEAAFCALAIHHRYIPGNTNLETPDPSCKGLNLLRRTLHASPGVTLSNSSGFGGSNVCLVLDTSP